MVARLAKLEVPALLKLRNEIDARLSSLRETLTAQLASLGMGSSPKHGRKPGAVRAHGLKGSTRPAKYRDPATGKTWAGVGMTPLWLKGYEADGKSREEFAAGANGSGRKLSRNKSGRKLHRPKRATRK
jgi:DNA-binding protein H-NS